MRGDLALSLGVSLGAHVLVAAALLAPRAHATAASADPAPQLAGETFELPAPETADMAFANASPSAERVGTSASPSPEEGDAPARPTPPSPAAHAAHARRPSLGKVEPGTSSEETAGSSAAPALYGAIGERSASDLATAFTRGFPQAASADPAWRAIPLGSAGQADVVLVLDDAGHIESAEVLGAPTPALDSAIRRTLALIRGRPFVAKGRVTKLHLVASVSADAVHDGLHGDVFAIGGSFVAGEGSAFFALAIGRRIDVRVRVK